MVTVNENLLKGWRDECETNEKLHTLMSIHLGTVTVTHAQKKAELQPVISAPSLQAQQAHQAAREQQEDPENCEENEAKSYLKRPPRALGSTPLTALPL